MLIRGIDEKLIQCKGTKLNIFDQECRQRGPF